MYLIKLWREIKIWLKVRKIAKLNEPKLKEKGFRIDWIGRIYTVINMPEEVINHTPQIQQAYVLDELRNFDKIFLDIGIADFIKPEFNIIPNTTAYLLILSPDRDWFRLKPFFIFIFKILGIMLLFRILYVLIVNYQDSILDVFNNIYNFIF